MLELLHPWPLVIVLDDGFRPELAPLIIEVAAERDEQICGLVWRFYAEAARERWSVN